MAPRKIDRISELAAMSLWEIKAYLSDLLRGTTGEGIIFYPRDIEALVKTIEKEVPPPWGKNEA